MITGIVNANLEATIRLTIMGPAGQPHEIEAIIDTGFTGFLTLPPTLVSILGLPYLDFPGSAANRVFSLMEAWRYSMCIPPPCCGTDVADQWKSKLLIQIRWWA